ncbi:MAG: hypothetical protein H6832_17125 [Planctomycetes bacterium]|nr:hypothetical protein [Planctomycetota bacterium]MCB9920126.1 hypothetical protein [Planctomycetota bacterium]
MSRQPNRRRSIVVNKRTQWRIVVEQAWPAGLAVLITSMGMCFFVTQVMLEANELAVELPSLPWVLVAGIGFVVVSLGVIAYCALRFSHRVAGPVYSIRRTLQSFRDGDTDARVRLRDGDFLTDLTDDLNDILERAARAPDDTNAKTKATASIEDRAYVEANAEVDAEADAEVEATCS